MQDFRNLRVWQKAHKLTLDAYAVSATNITHPRYFSLRDQLTRQRFQFQRTWRKAVERRGIESSGGSSEYPWVPPANLSIISFLRAT